MFLEIVSPEATLFAGEVVSVTLPGLNGEFQILSNHAPIVSLLQSGDVKIEGNIAIDEDYAQKFSTDSKGKTILSISSGTVEMKDNRVIVLAD
jgi:F-type H+-transporting ATPase subunit epsilon